ncbi:hypothetical protein K3729_03420 [Rhodobacteraceae bacterium S2214]|nr:hypothetical protein K3729_03420 [Rhodobacteraceae bacterium S2214]
MRLLLLFIIGLTFGFGSGFLVAGGMGPSSHDHAGHGDMDHDMSGLLEWEGTAPDLSIMLMPEMGDAANLHIMADGFTFTPETVNTDPTQGTGHAHIYIDGVKLARAYSNWFHIDHIETGQVIRVTLNADNHAEWGKDGQPLAVEITAP